MHVKEAQLTTLTLEEQAMLATLMTTTTQLANKIEWRLPLDLHADYRQLREHSPTPWAVLHWKLPITCSAQSRQALALRAALEGIARQLHDVVHAMADSEQTPNN
jgi:hypothetical protein